VEGQFIIDHVQHAAGKETISPMLLGAMFGSKTEQPEKNSKRPAIVLRRRTAVVPGPISVRTPLSPTEVQWTLSNDIKY
jgi:hypothetical protein